MTLKKYFKASLNVFFSKKKFVDERNVQELSIR